MLFSIQLISFPVKSSICTFVMEDFGFGVLRKCQSCRHMSVYPTFPRSPNAPTDAERMVRVVCDVSRYVLEALAFSGAVLALFCVFVSFSLMLLVL